MSPLNPKITDWRGLRVWILGASSGIGASLARQLAGMRAQVALSARREAQLREIAAADDVVLPLDVADISALQAARDLLLQRWGEIDLVIYCAGAYTPMRAWEIDTAKTSRILDTNLLGAYHTAQVMLPYLMRRGAGGICLVASAAGYTGLPKALAYGPGKAALINLAEILYTDLSSLGIGVYVVNPGFVETRLTQLNDFRMPALITADDAAREIVNGLARGGFEIHFPRRFTRWMKLLACLPYRLRFYLLKKAVQT
jgi:short-subunit dehydrogenase